MCVNARVWYLKHARLLKFLRESRTILREWEHWLSHLLDARQRARVLETLPTKKELRLWL